MAKNPYFRGIKRRNLRTLVLSLPAEYEFKDLFVTLTISLIAVNLVINPILLGRYLKKTKVAAE